MTSHAQRELRELMKEEGFWVLRQNGHIIWTDGELRICTAASPSCHRAVKNIRALILRARAAAREPSRKP